MSEDKEKLDIEDIKDPESTEETEIDLDEVVSEETPEEKPERVVETESPVTQMDTVLEEPKEASINEEIKAPKRSSKKGWIKYAVIGLTVALVGAAITLGVMYYLQKKDQSEVADTKVEESVIVDEVTTEDEAETEIQSTYVSSQVGLNLRETPDTKGKILIIIPFGTKLTVLEQQTGWIKTTYDGKTGWVSSEYTQATDPFIYQDKTYGFGFTFKKSWAGYHFYEQDNASESTTVKTYYVCLPTTDKNWDETSAGVPKGYASLFVMGIYTKEEWAKLAGGEMLPAKLGEGSKYVYTYLPAQAYAVGTQTQYSEINEIIKTFEVLN